jgi:cyclophilin family peptidyl-prolyl cis-trans isomerase
MARASSPNSANSQFFIVLKDSRFLDGQYTVFGRVIEGMDVVDKIKKGGGAKSVSSTAPEIFLALETLVEAATKGDPELPMRWTNKGLRKLSAELEKQGFRVSHSTVAALLEEMGYSLYHS